MDDVQIARIVHVVSVLFWIGGVGFVTLVLIPSVRAAYAPEERLHAFHAMEQRFAPQARLWVALAGLSGFWMTWRADLWSRFADPRFWWMHAMVGLWALFALMLYVAEPLFLHRRMAQSTQPAVDFDRMDLLHRLLLALACLVIVGAVGGGHGLF